MTLFAYDQAIRIDRAVTLLCGVDEAGRGPLAGPVVAAAVILRPETLIDGLDDSKKLSEKKREKLYTEIIRRAHSYAVASASAREIDELNILQATFLAMRRAVEALSAAPQLILIDGNRCPPGMPLAEWRVEGDGLSASVAAASILAKVTRDRYMSELARQYPQYGFERHKGYPTPDHYEKLLEHGPADVYRQSFLRTLEAHR